MCEMAVEIWWVKLTGTIMTEITAPRNLLELTGQKRGHLTALYRLDKKDKRGQCWLWLCKCDCGRKVPVSSSLFNTGVRTSCGCQKINNWRLEQRHRAKGPITLKTRLRSVYRAMIAGCYDHRSRYYADNGGKGISVCDEWRKSFHSFGLWALPEYKVEFILVRIDNNGDYEPTNCMWELPKELPKGKERYLRLSAGNNND